ncbi:MAG: hypothetical protein HZB65_01090 [Candidatus Aenigmarchaeota archaeon]|nr:hypothetical protein [Candidatus Aenigmarchaeota archaeon]
MHLTIGIYGNIELASKLGKKGTMNDIAIFNHGSSEGVFTYVCPDSEKIQPLLQTLHMIDLPVLVVKELTKEIGEMLLAIDEMDFEKGFIITDLDLSSLIKGTSLERFRKIEENQLREELSKVIIERKEDSLVLPIDNYFNVKSVGTVILSIMRSGSIKKYDKVMIEPLGKEVVVKGIQSQDKDIEQADAGMRIGLSLKGVEIDELKRGFVICKNMKKSNAIKIRFRKNKFFRQDIKQGMPVFVSIGLQAMSSIIEDIKDNEITIKTNQPVAYRDSEKCILASQSEQLPRIIGSGIIV